VSSPTCRTICRPGGVRGGGGGVRGGVRGGGGGGGRHPAIGGKTWQCSEALKNEKESQKPKIK